MNRPFEKLFNFIKTPWVIIFYAFLVILAYYLIDRTLATYFCQMHLEAKIFALKVLTALGKWILYVLLFFMAALFFRYIKINSTYEKRSWYLLGCVVTTNLVCTILKITLSRARPELLFASNEFGFYWLQLNKEYWSFPSGHTATVTALAGGLGVLFPRHFYSLLFIAFLVVISRLLLCFHYLSDVMSALYMSLLVVGFFTEYLQRKSWFKTVL